MIYSCEKCGQRYQIDEPGMYRCSCGFKFDVIDSAKEPQAVKEKQQTDEDLIIKKHWRGYLPGILIHFLIHLSLCIVIILLLKLNPDLSINYLYFVLFLLFMLSANIGICALDRYITEYQITKQRITKKNGLLSIKKTEIWISDIRGVSSSQSIFERVLGVGHIEIGTAATSGVELTLESVLDPDSIVQLINDFRSSNR